MTHGVIINGETYVAERVDSVRNMPCESCAIRQAACYLNMKDYSTPCESANYGEVVGIYYMRRVIFIQPTQPKKGQAK